MPPVKAPIELKDIKRGPIASVRVHTNMFVGNKELTPNNPAETSAGWSLVEDGDYLWLRYQDGPWARTHASNVRFVLYEKAKP